MQIINKCNTTEASNNLISHFDSNIYYKQYYYKYYLKNNKNNVENVYKYKNFITCNDYYRKIKTADFL